MDELQKQIKARKIRNTKRLRDNYAFAKQLGFTSAEAGCLCQRSAKKIKALADERQNKKNT